MPFVGSALNVIPILFFIIIEMILSWFVLVHLIEKMAIFLFCVIVLFYLVALLSRWLLKNKPNKLLILVNPLGLVLQQASADGSPSPLFLTRFLRVFLCLLMVIQYD